MQPHCRSLPRASRALEMVPLADQPLLAPACAAELS